MTAVSTQFNRRELSYWLLFSTIALLLTMVAAGSVWMMLGATWRANQYNMGVASYFATSDAPYAIKVGEDRAWVVNLDGELIVFSGIVPEQHCIFAWNLANMQFEDPCSGSQFRLDGTIVRGPARRDLTRMRHFIADGQLFVMSNDQTLGACRIVTTELRAFSADQTPPLCDE